MVPPAPPQAVPPVATQPMATPVETQPMATVVETRPMATPAIPPLLAGVTPLVEVRGRVEDTRPLPIDEIPAGNGDSRASR